jgi:hypothetical protein
MTTFSNIIDKGIFIGDAVQIAGLTLETLALPDEKTLHIEATR